jgi:hypothetical protein
MDRQTDMMKIIVRFGVLRMHLKETGQFFIQLPKEIHKKEEVVMLINVKKRQ